MKEALTCKLGPGRFATVSLGFPYFFSCDANLISELKRGYRARVLDNVPAMATRAFRTSYATPEYIAGLDYEVGRDC